MNEFGIIQNEIDKYRHRYNCSTSDAYRNIKTNKMVAIVNTSTLEQGLKDVLLELIKRT